MSDAGPASESTRTRAAGLMTLSVLMGATLLFGMEPMVGRLLVPFYGSAVSTWLTALMFFQVTLFFGYLYAHLLAPRIGVWHLAVLALAVPFLPLGIEGEIAPEAPMTRIVWSLIRHIGIPFFVLSTSAVVVQLWWARSPLGRDREPYPLYAASNAGSLLALLGYPFLVEPIFGLHAQSWVWTLGYAGYLACLGGAWYLARPDLGPGASAASESAAPTASDPDSAAPSMGDLALWAFLAALPSGFLLAVTSVIATEVGSFPMVWILPLAAFLGTFVLLFRDRPIGLSIRHYWPEITAISLLGYTLTGFTTALLLAAQLGIFFLYCMAVHGELYARRPSPRHLTRYYLAISFGGGVGGAVVNFGPPVWFNGFWEYPILVLLFGGLFAALSGRALGEQLKQASRVVAVLRLVVFQGATAIALFGLSNFYRNPPLTAHRNFYGVFRVVERDPVRMLVHGSTNHGSQYIDPEKRPTPTAYFHFGGGLHQAYQAVPGPDTRSAGRRFAVLGLGAGVVGRYMEPGDTLDFFEIDPANEAIAREWFTWLEESPATVSVAVGDGRLELLSEDRIDEPRYDLIHLDAFSGDGIPTHLLTVEAVDGYLQRLAPDGLLLFHISNRYYDLRPIIESLAAEHGLQVVHNPVEDRSTLLSEFTPVVAAVAARNDAALAPLRAQGWHDAPDDLPTATVWTDDYINILWPLYWRQAGDDLNR